jgi:uncharacterized protein (DUF2235 family)
MSFNLVICCDGTNNSLQRDLTNVALLSMVVDKTPGLQHVYYDAGVGVDAAPGLVTRIGATISRWSGLAFGTGLVANVSDAYREIVDHYQPGTRLYLFGFSRGAYTVRVLTGLLHRYGLLTVPHRDKVDDIVEQFQKLFPKEGSRDATDPVRRADYLRRTFSEAATRKRDLSVDCPVHFLGLWDTVSSLGWAYDPKTFPNTADMPNARTIRHALAIDERRAKFRTNRVHALNDQDLKEVWFAGVHADVGGGYPAAESGLAHVCLRWMLREAIAHDLRVDPSKLQQRGLDGPATSLEEMADQHESLSGAWWGLEYLRLPHRRQVDNEWVNEIIRYQGTGWRTIGSTDRVSRSLQRRAQRIPVKNVHCADVVTTVVWED